MKMKRFFNWLIIFMLCVALFLACKKEPSVTGVTLNKGALLLETDSTEILIATVHPENVFNKNVTWTSDNPAVATVTDHGLVTAVGKGNATITVMTQDGNKTATCSIIVSPSGPLCIVQWSDPQVGWNWVGYEATITQAQRAVQLINEIAPDVLLITGDMVHFPDNDAHINKFLEIIAPVKAPIIVTPGNHDIVTVPGSEVYRPVTVEGLQRYRSFFGNDFQTMECKGYTIISANSTLWYPEGAPPEEISRHDKMLNEALQNAQNKNQPIIAMTHYPPLFNTVPEKYFKLLTESGAFLWLSGHWHSSYRHEFGTCTLLVGESTSANETCCPLGIRVLTIYPDKSFDWDFIPLY